MKVIFLSFFIIILGCIIFTGTIACNNDNDDDDDNTDSETSTGSCDDYCEKVISCGDPSWTDVAECSGNCETSDLRDCFLECDTSEKCGDFFTCMTEC